MTITITLDSETEKVLERKAARLKISVSEYVEKLAQRSARPKATRKADESGVEVGQRLQDIIDRADPVELRANGIVLSKTPAKTGSELIRNLLSAGLLNGYGDHTIDPPELARQIRESFCPVW
jgi:hypothetical protein